MSKGVSRRRFLAGALGGGVSAAFLTMFGSSPSYASDPTAAAMVAARVKQSLGGSAEGLGGKLPLGSALADLRKGWDGTVWAADRQGVPHTYDALAGEWKIFGNGFDVICRWDVHANTYFVTRGDQISVHGAAPQALTALWSGLPDTFAQGIDGAANVNGTIYLFRHGRYLAIDGSGKAGPAAVLRDTIANWPGKGTGNAWDQGAVTVVGCYSGSNPAGETRVLLWAGAEFVFLDMATKTVTDGPHSLEWYVGGQMYDGMKQGFTTMLWDETAYDVKAFNGPILWHTSNRNGDASASYANAYQASWVPLVTAAPAGVAGDLWAADRDGNVVHHDGADWQPAPPVVSKKAYHLAAGADGTVMALTSGGLERWTVQAAGSSWATVAGVNFAADRVTVGDADHVYLRATDNTARRWQTTGFTTLSLGHPAYDIAAGSDGTLWSAARDGRLYRYLTEGTAGSTSLDPGLPSGSVIIRVAATGFDSAYLLTEDAQAHQYRTPFVFKTSKAYFQDFSPRKVVAGMTATGHTLYLSTSRPSGPGDQPDLVAIDTQTGLPRWTYRLPESGALASMPHVLDPATNTIHQIDHWKIAGIDADTGAQTAAIDLGSITRTDLGQPVMADGTLYVGSMDGHLIAVDVSDPSRLAVRWSVELGDRQVGYTPGAPAVDAAGQVYIVMHANGAGTRTASAVRADGTLAWQKALAGVWDGNPDLPYDIVIGQRIAAKTSVPALFVNNALAVACLAPGDGTDLGSFAVPQPTSGPGIGISSGLVLQNNTLYFGDTNGRVFIVDALALTAHRMVETGSSTWGVIGRPALIPGADPAAGDAVVAVTCGARQVYFVDPTTGALDTLVTDQTAPAALSYDAAHGVLYAMAWQDTGEQADQIGQLFAIRPDSYVQDERSFIVESELMQDFGSEAEAAAAATTGGASRYQTHVTIVDGAKAPRPNMAVKLWADEDATVVAIDGQSFTIGPDTPAYFAADASGSFTITSDATDLATTTLRMWAAFMDEHERIAVIPDAAFHQRLAQTTATGSADPDQIDLVSATDYQGKPLFAAGEKDQAGQAATAVTQLTGSTGIGAPTNLQAKAGDADARYLTYPNTPGLDYSPVAVPVDRSVDSQDTAGIHLAAGGAVSVSPAQAASLLDDMSGTAVTLPGGILSTLRAAWHEIKTTAAKVEQVVISVAKDVLAGIQYVVDGVVKVVKVVVRDIKDAAAAVGAFFVQLGKDIVKVIQALGKLLALGEVVKTADMFKGWLTTTLTTGVPAMLTRARSLLSTWFAGAEQEVADTFCKLSTGLGLGGCGGTDSTPMKDRPNMGSTPSSIYGGAGANAVQAGWSTQTLRTQGGSDSDSASVSTQATGSDPIAALETVFETFLSDVSGDPTLSAQFANMKNAFGKAFTATSADQFFASALQGVVDLMSTVAVLSLSVTHALLDSFLAAAQTMMDAILGLGTANIPVLSSLYKAITGKTLSFLDLICFVLAFPVTYLFRALQGVFPSQAGTLQATAGTPKLSLEGKIVGLFTAAATIAAGVISSLISGAAAFRIPPPKPLLFGGAVLVVLGWVGVLFNAGWSQGTSGKFNDNLTVLGALSTVGTALAFVRPKTPVGKQALAVAVMGNSLITAIFSWKKYEDSQTTSAKEPGTTLTKEFFMVIPGVLAPLKFQPFPLKMIPPVCDLLFRWAAAAIILDQLITDWDAVTEPEPPTSTPPATSTAASTTRSTTTSTTRRSTTAAPTTAVSSTTSGPIPPHGASLANTGVDVPTLVGVGVTATAVGGFLALTARRNRIALERAGSDRPAHR